MPLSIYHFFPLLGGSVERWSDHLDRIGGMGFDAILLAPFHQPGESGSVYAPRDLRNFHPICRPANRQQPLNALARFVAAARKRGIAVLMDVDLCQVASDSTLAGKHPDWVTVPTAESDAWGQDPIDPRSDRRPSALLPVVTRDAKQWKRQAVFWKAEIAPYLRAGIAGFRCTAVHLAPAGFWQALLPGLRDAAGHPLTVIADTLGAPDEAALGLADAGFDAFLDSTAWWDFRADWLFDQRAQYRALGPTIAEPEHAETDRLARANGNAPANRLRALYAQRAALAAAVSAGWMVPMGFEVGMAASFDGVAMRPGDWTAAADSAPFDLSALIRDLNALRRRWSPLATANPPRRLSGPDSDVVGFARFAGGDASASDAAVVALINRNQDQAAGIDPGHVLAALDGAFALADVTPGAADRRILVPGEVLHLAPGEARLFAGERRAAKAAPAPTRAASSRAIAAVADRRVTVERVAPEVDAGLHPVKRVVGDVLEVSADIFCDGHDVLGAAVAYRAPSDRRWTEVRMAHVDNDRWAAQVPLTEVGRYSYTILAWRDRFASWRAEVAKKLAADQDVALEVEEACELVAETARRAKGRGAKDIAAEARRLQGHRGDHGAQLGILLSSELADLFDRFGERANLARYPRELEALVDRTAARFAAWYEMFPRSQSGTAGRHGTFDDVIRRLPYVRDLGFDVLYFPPIHPIGKTNRKGRNNALQAASSDPGSPYAIGGKDGGHTAIHPEFGTLDDFRRLVTAAHAHGLAIALDFAIQCSPDHPWLKQHPDWFDWRPDGTIKFAENPPKKYEDIVNVHFYGKGCLPELWLALRDVVLFWVNQGVSIFRIDNPHTKPHVFWQWLIREVQDQHPGVIFLAEAFTRPKVMRKLAKLGFTQSYTYFTWRNDKQGLIDYLTELTQSEMREYFRPNFFANTPDINPPVLQSSRPGAYRMRLVLAATLSGVYGIYNGFELCDGTPLPGREEYLNSEKYEIRAWDWDRPGNIRDDIARINRIRRHNPALQTHLGLLFLNAWNDNILAYAKMTPARDNVVVVAVNLDPDHPQEANFEIPLWEFGLPDHAGVMVDDLLSDTTFAWQGKVQHVWLDPAQPCAIWRIRPLG